MAALDVVITHGTVFDGHGRRDLGNAVPSKRSDCGGRKTQRVIEESTVPGTRSVFVGSVGVVAIRFTAYQCEGVRWISGSTGVQR